MQRPLMRRSNSSLLSRSIRHVHTHVRTRACAHSLTYMQDKYQLGSKGEKKKPLGDATNKRAVK